MSDQELAKLLERLRADLTKYADEVTRQEAEIERLRNSLPMQTIAVQQTKLNEAATFLDGLAERLDDMIGQGRRTPTGDECRTMAKKLRERESL
jgi:hypothetical protein